jgi:hypothetical protein
MGSRSARAARSTSSASERFRIHLLTLADVFSQSAALQQAAQDLPPLRDMSEVITLS